MTALTRCLAALGMTLAATAAALMPVPPVARVTDLTDTLTVSQRAGLEQRLAAFEKRKGSQIAVLMVRSTSPETIEQYSLRVAEAWKLGRKDVDDGILLLVAKEDRALRIEVGYGLEGAVPDAIAKRIIEEHITPRFRDGDFHGGLNAGVDHLIRVVDGEPLPAPQNTWSQKAQDDAFGYVLFAIFLPTFFGRLLGRRLSVFAASLSVGLVSGFIAGLMLDSVFVGAVFGVVAFVLGLFLLATGAAGHGGWSSGSGWGGGRSGGSFSSGGGGGFSGGGGSFGGGGSSGRW